MKNKVGRAAPYGDQQAAAQRKFNSTNDDIVVRIVNQLLLQVGPKLRQETLFHQRNKYTDEAVFIPFLHEFETIRPRHAEKNFKLQLEASELAFCSMLPLLELNISYQLLLMIDFVLIEV